MLSPTIIMVIELTRNDSLPTNIHCWAHNYYGWLVNKKFTTMIKCRLTNVRKGYSRLRWSNVPLNRIQIAMSHSKAYKKRMISATLQLRISTRGVVKGVTSRDVESTII